MIRRFAGILTAALLMAAFSYPASAHLNTGFCGDHATITARLGNQYGQSRERVVVAHVGGLVEIFTSPQGAWTMLLTRPDKTACVVATGHGWQNIPPAVESEGPAT